MNWKKWIPLFIIIVLMGIAYFSGIPEYLMFDHLKTHRENLLASIEAHPILSSILFMLLYISIVTLSLPGGAILSVVGGFLFGTLVGVILVVVSASIGATLIFLAAKTALGDVLKHKAQPFLQKMERGFKKNAANYLLFLRFIPVFPFWLVNIAPAFFQVRLWTYVWTTCIGIIPGSYIYTQAGTGLGAIFDTGEAFTVGAIFNIQMRIALIVLGVFALIPIFVKPLVKKFGKKKSDR